ncbi:MAG: 50S ribosome-binding GTPase, partial [Terriglobus roseus]|nr:50S ribosome-binding GTPase [Terriglobus roseus]
DCDCGQEEKVVVFIGRTQNGKSSTIQSLLNYGGRETAEQADKVNVGRNTASCTKHVSSYYAKMSVDKHTLLDDDDQPVKATADNVWDHRPHTRRSGNHVHLRFVDTPGLNDSAKPHKLIAKEVQLREPVMKSVDEQHKVLILQELAKIPKIHAVVIVLKPHALSGSVQEDVRQYLDLLKLASLGERIHFVYTHVNVDTMFDANILTSPQVTEEQFGLCEDGAKQHMHFFLNNEPDEEISQHFTDHTLAAMLDSFRRQQGRSTSGLMYPKCTAHKLMDQDLVASIKSRKADAVHERLQSDRKVFEARDALLEHHKLFEKERAAAEEAEEIVEKWDNEEYEEMAFQNRSLGDIPFVRRELEFNFQTDFPIRKFKYAETWYDEQWGTVGELGQKTHYAVLIGARGKVTTGWCRMYGWAKEIHAAEIEEATLRGEAAREAAADHLEKMRRAQDEVSEAERAEKHAKLIIEQAEAALAPFAKQTFSVADMQRYASNMTVENLLHYAEMYPCELRFTWESLKWHRNQREILFEPCEDLARQVEEILQIQARVRECFDMFEKQLALVAAEQDAAERRLEGDITA